MKINIDYDKLETKKTVGSCFHEMLHINYYTVNLKEGSEDYIDTFLINNHNLIIIYKNPLDTNGCIATKYVYDPNYDEKQLPESVIPQLLDEKIINLLIKKTSLNLKYSVETSFILYAYLYFKEKNQDVDKLLVFSKESIYETIQFLMFETNYSTTIYHKNAVHNYLFTNKVSLEKFISDLIQDFNLESFVERDCDKMKPNIKRLVLSLLI